VLAVADRYRWKEGCRALNFEESRCHDLGRYEVLPLVMLTFQVFLGCDIPSFGKYCDRITVHMKLRNCSPNYTVPLL
jgi:hypothetical protein